MTMINTCRQALLKQIMDQKQTLISSVKSCAGERTETLPAHDNSDSTHMIETRIYVGLNDADTKTQKHETG